MAGINISNTLPPTQVTDFTENGQCSQCGNCCGNLLSLTKDEIVKIQRYVKKHKIKPHVINAPLQNPTIDLTCPFLNMEKSSERCNIYPVRPYICRRFNCSENGLERYTEQDVVFAHSERTNVNMRKTFFN